VCRREKCIAMNATDTLSASSTLIAEKCVWCRIKGCIASMKIIWRIYSDAPAIGFINIVKTCWTAGVLFKARVGHEVLSLQMQNAKCKM